MTKPNLRAKMRDTIVRIVEQWLACGEIKVGNYKFSHTEIALQINFDRITPGGIDTIIGDPGVEYQNGSEKIT